MRNHVRRALQAALVITGLLSTGVLAATGGELWLVTAALLLLVVGVWLRGRAGRAAAHRARRVSFVPHQRGASDRS